MRPTIIAMVLLVALVSIAYAGDGDMSLDDVIAKLCSEIQLGLSRAEVERVLEGLPVNQGYRPKGSLHGPERTFEGRQVSGIFVITTHADVLTRNFYMKRQAFFSVMFDENGRVLAVTVDAFGMPAPSCPRPK